MKCRTLGNFGLKVFPVGLGCMGLSQSYPPFPDKKEAIAFLRRAVEMGGEALKPVREQVVIATKFGWDIRDGKCLGLDSRPETIRKAVEGSLRRLRTDHIDLYDQHRVDPRFPLKKWRGLWKNLCGRARSSTEGSQSRVWKRFAGLIGFSR